jgi:hypothetical protein
MDAQHNPYQAPSLAASEELTPSFLPERDAFTRYLTANQVVSSLFMAMGFGGAILFVVILFNNKSDPPLNFASGTLLGTLVVLGMAGVYQRRHKLIAMMVSAFLATALVVLLLACIPFGILRGIYAGNMHWGTALGSSLLICGLSWLFITPLRLFIQAWRWTSAGINLKAFEKEIRGRA